MYDHKTNIKDGSYTVLPHFQDKTAFLLLIYTIKLHAFFVSDLDTNNPAQKVLSLIVFAKRQQRKMLTSNRTMCW